MEAAARGCGSRSGAPRPSATAVSGCTLSDTCGLCVPQLLYRRDIQHRMPRLALPPLALPLALLLALGSLPPPAASTATNPNLKYFGVWEAENGCGGAAGPQQQFDGFYHYPKVTIPTHQAGRTACPDGDCVIKTFAAASHLECEAACNATNAPEKCVAVLLARSPSGPMNCTLLLVGGPGVGSSAHDTYVATWAADAPVPADHGAGAPAPNLTCQAEQSKWMNFLFTSADPLAIKRYHRAGMGPSLLHVRETFFCGSRLCVDYKERWAALLASTVKPMLKEKSLFGIFFGDEICEQLSPPPIVFF